MASFLDKIKVASAVQTRNTFDLSHINLTTQAFYSIKPVYSKELIPGESITIDYSQFTRLMPLSEPMMAHCNIVTRAFFVPYRTVWPLWSAFITGAPTNYRGTQFIPSKVPTITSDRIFELFTYSDYSTIVPYGYDFTYEVDGSTQYRRFTPLGRRVYDILLNLGYSINFTSETSHEFSALPILSWARLFLDWMQNSNYDNINVILNQLLDAGPYTAISASDLSLIFKNCSQALYRTDLFTSAFDNPTGPNVNTNSVSFPLQSATVGATQENVSKQPNFFSGTTSLGSSNGRITQNGLYILHALTDYYERLRSAGSRVLDRYFAEFGAKLSNEKLNRSVYLGGHANEISILDVMDTSSTGLGDYAGKGIGNLEGSFNYKTDEFGQLIILSYIEPRTSVCQGFDRNNLHLTRFDYFSGDMDAIGYQAISQGELFADYKGATFQDFADEYEYDPIRPFGYSGRYYEYKVANDKLTGQFRVPSINGTYDRWHLFRMIPNDNDIRDEHSDLSNKPLRHGLDFTIPTRPTIYNRVFADHSNNSADPFFARWSFRVKSSLPAKPLYEQYEYASHGEKNIIQLGGTRVTN